MSKSSLEPFVCVIPLKPTDDPLKEEQVQKLKGHMLDEYAVRYLESIGATPTAANIKKVREEIQPDSYKLTAAFKSRGGLEDMFYLSNVEPKNEGRHLWRSYAARSMFADLVDKKLAPTSGPQQEKAKEGKGRRGGGGSEWGGKEAVKQLPKLPATIPAPSRPPPLSPSKRDDMSSRVALARMGGGLKQNAKLPKTPDSARSVNSRRKRNQYVNDHGVQDEALPNIEDLELHVTMDDVLSIQTMFTRTFPLAHVQARLQAEDLAVLVGELTGLAMAQLILNVSHLCEWLIVHKADHQGTHSLALTVEERATGAQLSKRLEALVLEVFGAWVEMQGRIAKPAHMVVALPIYLMLLRVGVETLFRNALPVLFKTPQAEVATLDKIEHAVSTLLDPDGYLNFPPPAPPGKNFVQALQPSRSQLQVTHPALVSSAQKPWAPMTGGAGRRVHPSAKFHTVSPMVRNLVSVAESPALRILKNKSQRAQAEAAHQRGEDQHSGEEEGLKELLNVENVNQIYLLALKKRHLRQQLAERQKPKIINQEEKRTLEEREEEVLHAILPHGVEYMNKRTHA